MSYHRYSRNVLIIIGSLLPFLDTSSASIRGLTSPHEMEYKPSWEIAAEAKNNLVDNSGVINPKRTAGDGENEDPYYFLNKDLYHPDSYLKKPHPYFGIMTPVRRPIHSVISPFQHKAFGKISDGRETLADLVIRRPPVAVMNMAGHHQMQIFHNLIQKAKKQEDGRRKGC